MSRDVTQRSHAGNDIKNRERGHVCEPPSITDRATFGSRRFRAQTRGPESSSCASMGTGSAVPMQANTGARRCTRSIMSTRSPTIRGRSSRVMSSPGTSPRSARGSRASARTSICAKYATVGLHRDGALAEYVRVPAHIAVRAEPFGLRPDVAVLTQPMAIAVHAMRRGRPQANEQVLVIGAGGIGAFLIYALSQAGAAVAAVDVSPQRVEIARRLGARYAAASATAIEIVPTLVFEASGADAGLAAAIRAVEPGGRVVTVGLAKHPLEIDARRVTVKELEIIGTNALIGAQDVPEAARLLSVDQRVWSDVAPLAIPLERLVSDGIEPMLEGRATRIKTIVDPWISAPRPTATA